jgi:hypothetical protein
LSSLLLCHAAQRAYAPGEQGVSVSSARGFSGGIFFRNPLLIGQPLCFMRTHFFSVLKTGFLVSRIVIYGHLNRVAGNLANAAADPDYYTVCNLFPAHMSPPIDIFRRALAAAGKHYQRLEPWLTPPTQFCGEAEFGHYRHANLKLS